MAEKKKKATVQIRGSIQVDLDLGGTLVTVRPGQPRVLDATLAIAAVEKLKPEIKATVLVTTHEPSAPKKTAKPVAPPPPPDPPSGGSSGGSGKGKSKRKKGDH